ncbi:thermosome subunit [Candidatus Pacearchaeota archaeon CG10_big_fil_rev_8_21_14_0_10_34_76]|nr:MAG: thermosome subunit [Candidatus Pacearchaeota archaeon CG10_big_fil_rev_8_21_14_0_10_34_76]
MSDKQPVYIMPENVSRTVGRDAQRNNILAARVVSEIVKTTLGPKGMDKMLVDSTGDIIITNDGVTILNEMEIDHPAAKIIAEIAKTQENEVGDGTTTVAMLAGKFLENAEKLLDKRIHPTVIARGYALAAEKSKEILKEISIPLEDKSILKQIAMTAMTGKGAEGNRSKFADLIVAAADRVSVGNEINIDDIKIEKIKGEDAEKSELVEGVVLNKEVTHDEMPKKIHDAKIVLFDLPLELRSPEREAKVSISTPQQLQEFITSEEVALKGIADKVIASGANVVFCQKGIDDVAQYYLARAGIMAFRRVSKSDMSRLARATSGKIISNINELSMESFGKAKLVEEVKRGDEAITYIRGCENPKSVTILVYGSTSHVIDEMERAIKDGLGDVISAVKSGRVVAGGGAVEIELAKRLREYSKTLGGREQLAVEEFALALESIPETLAENAGLDPINVLTELKQRHASGASKDGLNLFNDKIEDCIVAGIIEPLKVKMQAVSSATEVAIMILRIDDILISSGNKRSGAGMNSNPYAGME